VIGGFHKTTNAAVELKPRETKLVVFGFFPSGAESSRTFHTVLHEVLLLVSGEVYKVPQPERLHHGERIIMPCRFLLL